MTPPGFEPFELKKIGDGGIRTTDLRVASQKSYLLFHGGYTFDVCH